MRGSDTRRRRLCSRHGRSDATGRDARRSRAAKPGAPRGCCSGSGSIPSEDIPAGDRSARPEGVLVAPGPKI